MTLSGKTVLLVIGGGIAAYKSLELIREIARRGGKTRCILTRAGAEFVTPLSVSGLSGETTYSDLFSLTHETEMGHIQLSRAADIVVIAPATADLMAKAAHGLANDLASTALLATDKPVLMAPAMNVRMWQHRATQRNLATLIADGIRFVGPTEGEMACGEFGPGRMAEPAAIADAIAGVLSAEAASGALAGRHVLITSGPTHEPIDPVRYVANRSSGRQGHALAVAARQAGARVTLISGPVSLPPPAGITVVPVETAREMLAAVEAALPADLAIFAAAVADWRVEGDASQKIKKGAGGPPAFSMVENPDILATIAQRAQGRPPLVIGFAAETEKVVEHAQAKLARKRCDLIVANDVSAASGVMGGATNAVHLVTRDGVESWPRLGKEEVAAALIARFATMLPQV